MEDNKPRDSLEELIFQYAETQCKLKGYSHNYLLKFHNELKGKDKEDKFIIVSSGSTPTIHINRAYVLVYFAKMLEKQYQHEKLLAFQPIRNGISRALEKVSKQEHTLYNKPISSAISLGIEDKKWKKEKDYEPKERIRIHDKYFSVELQINISVSESISGVSVTRLISSPGMIQSTIEEIKTQLSNMIIDDEEKHELLDMIEIKTEKDSKPNEIEIDINKDGISEKNIYTDKEDNKDGKD